MSKIVSFSQMSTFHQCRMKWKLRYIDKHRLDEGSIHATFGTAVHETIQHYLTVMYNESVKKADEIDLSELLLEKLTKAYNIDKERVGDHFSTKEELKEFYEDGLKVIHYLKKNRRLYFSRRNYELVGIEVPLNIELITGVNFTGYLDIVLRNTKTGEIHIIDIKTSTRGWKNEKKDKIKNSQLLIYKKFYSDLFNVPLDKIHITFLILRRKIWEEAEFPMSRIQTWAPANGKVSINRSHKYLTDFVEFAFTPDGEYNLDQTYEATPGENNYNCRFCPYKNRKDLCSKR